MKVTVCIGSYCHLKGSRTVAERLRERIAAENLEDKIDLAGTFCMGNLLPPSLLPTPSFSF